MQPTVIFTGTTCPRVTRFTESGSSGGRKLPSYTWTAAEVNGAEMPPSLFRAFAATV